MESQPQILNSAGNNSFFYLVLVNLMVFDH